jgi:hypothetical protein
MGFQGIDVRQTGDRLIFRSLLQDSTGAILSTGTANLKLYELQSDGTLKSYDWNDNTFKTTALTTENQALTHRTGNNAGTSTGIWTYALTTLSGFTAGNLYFAHVSHTSASPVVQVREFQFGVANAFDPFSQQASRSFASMVLGTVGAGSSTTSVVTSSLSPAAAVTDQFKNRAIIFASDTTTANLRGQVASITGSTSGGVLTVSTLTTAPASGDTFIIV